jgi:outer membrane receptor protein involved in Fe transport
VNIAVDAGRRAALHASYNRFFVPPAIEGVLSSSAGLTQQIREIGIALPPLEATIEDQFETGISSSAGGVQLAATVYYRRTDNPVHTTVWPGSRIYSYASFDRARAYGLEFRADARAWARYGATAYLNYALGRVNFYNPVTGGFITEAAHITDTNRFLAPMDQTHTLTGGATYRHPRSGAWVSAAIEYGSGTPIGHGGAHEHAEGEADHEDAAAGNGGTRVEAHFTGNATLGFDLLRHNGNRPRLTVRVDVENVANQPYVIARARQFSPAQYSNPRLISLTARVRF